MKRSGWNFLISDLSTNSRRRSCQSQDYRGVVAGTHAAPQKQDVATITENAESTQAPLTSATSMPGRTSSDSSDNGETVVTQASKTATATDLSRFREAQDELMADHSLHRRHSLAICVGDEASRTLSAIEERYFSWP